MVRFACDDYDLPATMQSAVVAAGKTSIAALGIARVGVEIKANIVEIKANIIVSSPCRIQSEVFRHAQAGVNASFCPACRHIRPAADALRWLALRFCQAQTTPMAEAGTTERRSPSKPQFAAKSEARRQNCGRQSKTLPAAKRVGFRQR